MELFSKYLKAKKKEDNYTDFFGRIEHRELRLKNIELHSQINSSTIKISSYFEKAIRKFPSLFNKNLNSFEECLSHLKKISIPNKCVCAGIIDAIPGWRCINCSKYENTIYCNDCYLKSKDLHKGHEVYYSLDSKGMCDCGNPDSLSTYCHEHSGPFVEQKQIDEYIQKSFDEKTLNNLTSFFDEFFLEFSKYLILTSKCKLFMDEIFDDKFNGNLNEKLINEKKDVEFIKSNFKIVFQNLIYFLRLITKNNLGMLHLISNYFLKNNLETVKSEDEFKTVHRCIDIGKKDMKISFDTIVKQAHECRCPFFRHFFVNYRDNIKLKSDEDEKEFMFSFFHNLPSRYVFGLLIYFLYNYMLYNYNSTMIYCRTQFYFEDIHELIAKNTTFIEDSTFILYRFMLKIMNKVNNDKISKKDECFFKIAKFITVLIEDIKHYTKPKPRKLMTDKISYFKNIIDIICLFQNINKYTSMVPHPQHQDKSINLFLFSTEKFLLNLPELLNCCIDWTKLEALKEIYKYIIYKILNQEKDGIKQLKENEFSFHLGLYRTFSVFINAFCFNYSFTKKCTLLQSIDYFKKIFFESQEQIENFADIIIKDYFKFFGFIFGIKNNFFKYYDSTILFFTFYTEHNYYQSDLTLLKYLFALSEKNLDILSYIKLSNIENVFSSFDKAFNSEINMDTNNSNLEKEQSDKNKLEKSKDELNIISQWEMLLEFLCFILKDDSSYYYKLLNIYEEILSSKTKSDLFNAIINNDYAMEDLKNLLQEKLIQNIILKGNLIDAKELEKKINYYFLYLFKKNNKIYNETLNKLTNNKINGETIMYYLKDEYLKYFDCDYFLLPKVKSAAQKYILDFKKNVVKTYNHHFYNHSELTFEFYLKMYEKVLLNKNNLDLIIRIIDKLINNEKILEYTENKSIRNNLLPVIFKYLQIFNTLNTKSFIEFKLDNKTTINKLYELIKKLVENNNKSNIIDKDLEEYAKEILNQINIYQLIFDHYEGDLTKLNKFDYNINISEQLEQNAHTKENNRTLISEENNSLYLDKQKPKNIKEKLKQKMKKKSNNFLKKIESDEEMIKIINEHINDLENMKNNNDETMCFYCRNSIKLNSFEEPFGKLGLYIKDLFYVNSIKSTLREECSKLQLNDTDYKKALKMVYEQKFFRIISCGHYFHNSCFVKGCEKRTDSLEFYCPLCLKYFNLLIPPLTLFHDKYNFFKSEKLNELFINEEEDKKKLYEKEEKENKEGIDLFNTTVVNFLISINVFKRNIKNYESFLDNIYQYYKAYLTYFENIFYVKGTTFHKQQQIDNMKNFILSLRLFIHDSRVLNKFNIVLYVKETLLKIMNGPEEGRFLFKYYDSYFHYLNLFEKIIFSMQILFDYEELNKVFKYILYIFLPYYLFGFYFKNMLILKQKQKMNEEQFNKHLNVEEFHQYLKKNNNQLLNNLKSFMQKFCFIKMITDYENKNDEIINSFNELNLKDILSIINMQDLTDILPESNSELSLETIINKLPKIFYSDEAFYKLFSKVLNFDNALNSIFNNVKKYNTNINYDITHELIIQFSPIKFRFIQLENNNFDLIEKYSEKKCNICGKISKKALLCLICGEKVCNERNDKNDESLIHTIKCTGSNCMFIKLYKMKLIYVSKNGRKLKLFHIYVNKSGNGAKGREITNEFNLNNEKMKLITRSYLSKEFHFKND